jgi:hypothetical protein
VDHPIYAPLDTLAWCTSFFVGHFILLTGAGAAAINSLATLECLAEGITDMPTKNSRQIGGIRALPAHRVMRVCWSVPPPGELVLRRRLLMHHILPSESEGNRRAMRER